ncbi:hypothetical protein CTAYLR_007469 [Chrysophaeum taylorii]|uniref:J domain-containing protein n=1 Tax=Chrysophaeum taylorii TaxID=2483200 RepID=A0AAD7UB62_9STRA|nr:hypothetical protein CTAYLR_007469 [Chrysophaeum taylorii]
MRKAVVKIPEGAAGLFVGRKRRNIRELQQSEGIKFLRVDFEGSLVEVVGTNAGIEKVRRRLDQAGSIAANAACYFPQSVMTVFDVDAAAAVRFKRFSSADYEGLAASAHFDADRTYHGFTTVRDRGVLLGQGLDSLGQMIVGGSTVEHPYVGFDSGDANRFFERVVRDALDVLASGSVVPSLYVKFGKMLLSSVPQAALERAFCAAELRKLPLGTARDSARPQFNGLFCTSRKESLIKRIAASYEHLLTAKEFRINCWRDDDTKKKFNVTFVDRPSSDDDDEDSTAEQAALRQVAQAETYFEILGVGSTPTDREVKVAFRKLALLVHPDKSTHPAGNDAFEVLSAAYEELRTEKKRSRYRLLGPPSKPKTRVDSRSLVPSLKKFRSLERKLAFFEVLRPETQADFRTTLETEASPGNSPVDREMLRAVEDAWEKRTENEPIVCRDGTALKMNSKKYVTSSKFTNGTFELAIEDSKEEWFGKTTAGVAFSLESYAVNDLLDEIKKGRSDDAAVRKLLCHIHLLHREARDIADLIDA